MTIEEFQEQINFASDAIFNKRREEYNPDGIKVLVTVPDKGTVCLSVKEIGFDDKEGIIYIEAS